MTKILSSLWSDQEAEDYIAKYSDVCSPDVALRTYTSRLIGKEDTLVLHGGGNTSVKARHTDLLGEEIDAIYVKGSGWDLVSIEPPGLPGLALEPLKRLRALESLSDEEMVNQLRCNLFLSSAPNPSVETLLHAFLPNKFIDHSHANSILALTNNVDSERMLSECFGDDVLYVPYVMPGFQLAKDAADVFETGPEKKGMVLLKHGLFTYGETARESYERHIELVNRASEYLASELSSKTTVQVNTSVSKPELVDKTLSILRGRLNNTSKSFVFELRDSDEALTFVNTDSLFEVGATGPLTPDHTIRTKSYPLLLDTRGIENEDELKTAIDSQVTAFEKAYDGYFNNSVKERGVERTKLDSIPRVVLIPGIGVVGVGESKKAASIAADIYDHTVSVKTLVSQISTYEALPAIDLFDLEYWSLEQAKLAKKKSQALSGKVALVTGGAGAIGRGIVSVLKNSGAEVILADIAGEKEAAEELGTYSVNMDVTDDKSVEQAFSYAIQEFGGLDIVVANAGVAYSSPIEELDIERATKLTEVNYHGYLRTVQQATRLLKRQGTGGHIIINSSKNVFSPGKEFSTYSATKAAGHQLGKVAALELAEYGIKVNMINADAVFSAGDTPSGLWAEVGQKRAEAHKIEFSDLQDFYKERNLLKTVISAEDVGRAVLFFVSDQTPTTGATLPVDGGVKDAFPR